MIYLKSIVAGIVAAFSAVVLCALAVIGWVEYQVRSTSQGGIGAVSLGSDWMLSVLLAAFVLGFWWEYRRARRKSGGTA